MDTNLPGAPASSQAAQDLAGNGQPGTTAPVAAVVPAAVSAPLFGGLRGSRPRKDGLLPGSPEAQAADRAKDRERKRRLRAGQAGPGGQVASADPPPLPAAGGPGAPVGGGADFGGDSVDGGPVPWDSKQLAPLFDQLIPAVEALAVTQLTGKALKAKLPRELVADIEKDGRWNEPAKKALAVAGPQLAAKYLNKTGVSAENQPEIVFGTALASIAVGHFRLVQRLNELIALSAVGQSSIKPAPPAAPIAPAAGQAAGGVSQ